MKKPLISRGFPGKRRAKAPKGRPPSGQYLTNDFPILSTGLTPRTPLSEWSFSVEGLVREADRCPWDEFQQLPRQEFDRRRFWESLGYHNYEDPWEEQRYRGIGDSFG